MKATKTIKDNCPVCKQMIDGATEVSGEGHIPEKDDITMCIYCMSILVFNADLTTRLMTDKEMSYLPHELRRQLQTMRRAVKEVMT